ncbi:hypothetical protein K7X08_027508 [Anisodus acutangulus]|uniref:Mechanosensitive ion channel MscS domain-containing protein n=1 Tax=Anisodus acutangulus TaxID=402998 RepID=A0A9Q1MMJ9_9SOLA|nr:hypothetical protein K7X08_027508 [Anisodus acutangulus]
MFGGKSKLISGRKSDVAAENIICKLPDRAPCLSQMQRFASGREPLTNFDWRSIQITTEDHRKYYTDADRGHSDDEDEEEYDEDEEEELNVTFAAPILEVVIEEKCNSAAICFVLFLPDMLDSKAEVRNKFVKMLSAAKFKRISYNYVWVAGHLGTGRLESFNCCATMALYVIETLSGPAFVEIDEPEHEEEEKIMATPHKTPMSSTPRSSAFSRVISEKEKEEKGGITIDHLNRLNQKNISAWNMKRLMNMVRKGVLSTLDEKLPESNYEDESAVHITSEKQAKAAAKKIFKNVAKPGSKFIYLEDLMCFMREDEALKTMRLIEAGTEISGISKQALKNWAVNAFRERRALALSLNDTKTAVNKLHQMLNVLVAIIILIIWLLIFRVATTHFLIFLSSQILLVVFIFGNSAKTTFEAIIFLFVMHPFDVGDRVEVDGVQMVVEEMNILTTVFLRYDNQKIIYPNSVLSTKPVSNYYRSPHMGDSVDFCIHISTPTEKIATMKERITRYIENKSDHWYPAPMIVMRDVEDLNGIKWSVWLSHTMNHQDMGERWTRRALLVEEMVKIFRELDIQYRMLPVDVNIHNLPSL